MPVSTECATALLSFRYPSHNIKMLLIDNEKTTVSMHKHLETMHESLNVLDCSK